MSRFEASGRLFGAAEIRLGRQRSPQHDSGPHMMRYLRAANVKDGKLDLADVNEMNFTPAEQEIFGLHPGDVLVTEGSGSLGAVGAAAVWNGEIESTVCFQNTLIRLRPRPGITDARYLGWWARAAYASGQFAAIASGANIYHLSSERVKGLPVRLPSLDEQRRIADFLDVNTAHIDNLIAGQLHMINLLEERRVAVTSSLIYGYGQDGAKKDSAIPTVGPISSTWKILRNKIFLREVVDLSVTGKEELLSVSHLTGVTPRSEKDVYMFLAESTVGHKRCQPGDLVINTLWAWMGALGVSQHSGILSPAYGVYRMTSDVMDGRYLDHLVRTPEYVAEMTRFSKGVWSSRLRLYPESFLALSIPVPPRDEQARIVAGIALETVEQEQLKSKLQSFAKVLVERRQALITAAVTGQIDVTTARGVSEVDGVKV